MSACLCICSPATYLPQCMAGGACRCRSPDTLCRSTHAPNHAGKPTASALLIERSGFPPLAESFPSSRSALWAVCRPAAAAGQWSLGPRGQTRAAAPPAPEDTSNRTIGEQRMVVNILVCVCVRVCMLTILRSQYDAQLIKKMPFQLADRTGPLYGRDWAKGSRH